MMQVHKKKVLRLSVSIFTIVVMIISLVNIPSAQAFDMPKLGAYDGRFGLKLLFTKELNRITEMAQNQDGNLVYATEKDGIHCITTQGQVVWKNNKIKDARSFVTGLKDNSVLLFTSDQKKDDSYAQILYAIDGATGKELWRKRVVEAQLLFFWGTDVKQEQIAFYHMESENKPVVEVISYTGKTVSKLKMRMHSDGGDSRPYIENGLIIVNEYKAGKFPDSWRDSSEVTVYQFNGKKIASFGAVPTDYFSYAVNKDQSYVVMYRSHEKSKPVRVLLFDKQGNKKWEIKRESGSTEDIFSSHSASYFQLSIQGTVEMIDTKTGSTVTRVDKWEGLKPKLDNSNPTAYTGDNFNHYVHYGPELKPIHHANFFRSSTQFLKAGDLYYYVNTRATINELHVITYSDTWGHWAEESIAALVDTKVIAGFDDGSFRPEAQVTRAQFIKMLFFNKKMYSNDVVFEDIPYEHWSFRYIQEAIDKGVVKPEEYRGLLFEPDKPLTRAEMASFIARFKNLETGQSSPQSFLDVQLDTLESDMITASVRAGYMNGYKDGTFRPNQVTKRSEAAAVLNKVLFE